MQIIHLLMLSLVTQIPSHAQDSDPLAGDTRLLKKHTIKAVGIPLKELLVDLTKQTGVQLVAGPRVAEDKIVLYAHDRPLVDSLRVIARFFDFYWGRSGQPGAYSYIISQSTKQQNAEAEEIEATYVRVAHQILKEARILQALEGHTPEELRALVEAHTAAAAGSTLPPQKRELMLKAGSARMQADKPYSAQLARHISSLGRAGVLELLRGGQSAFAYPAVGGSSPLPRSLADSIMTSLAARQPGNKEYNFARVELSGMPSAQPFLAVSVKAGAKSTGAGTSFSRVGLFFPADRSRPVKEPPEWENDPRFKRPVSFMVSVREPMKESNRGRLQVPYLARAVSSLEDSLPVDLIADAFFSTSRMPITVRQEPLGAALTKLCQNTGHEWIDRDGFIQVSETAYAAVRAGEPSIFRLRRWASLSVDQLFSLDRLGEIAAQTMPRFHTSLSVLSEACLFGNWEGIPAGRNHLLFWNTLTTAQRAAALSRDGLPYRRLSISQRQMFEQLTTDPGHLDSDSELVRIGVEALASAVLAVTSQNQPMWGLRRSDGFSLSGGPAPQMALQNLRRNNPDLWDIRAISYRFRYGPPGGPATAVIQLPELWSKPGSQDKAESQK